MNIVLGEMKNNNHCNTVYWANPGPRAVQGLYRVRLGTWCGESVILRPQETLIPVPVVDMVLKRLDVVHNVIAILHYCWVNPFISVQNIHHKFISVEMIRLINALFGPWENLCCFYQFPWERDSGFVLSVVLSGVWVKHDKLAAGFRNSTQAV